MKITKVQVHPEGPLKNGFHSECLGLNLIYGKNESGKTFILEALSAWLFGVGRLSPLKGKAREWIPNPTGSVEVSGLKSDSHNVVEIFGPTTQKNLQDHLAKELEMPSDLAKLLVVRAGEVLLESPESLVKNRLSAAGKLDALISAKRISKTIQAASVGDQIIEGKNQGELKTQRDAIEKLHALESLRQEYFDEKGLKLNALKQELQILLSEQRKLQAAKESYAGQIFDQIKETEDQIARINQIDLDDLKRQLHASKQSTDRINESEARLVNLDKKLSEKAWLESVSKKFTELTSNLNSKPSTIFSRKPIFLILSGLAVFGAVGSFAAGITIVSGVSGFLALLFLVFWFVILSKKSSASITASSELDQLKDDFQKKFGEQQVDEHIIQSKLAELIRLQGQRDQVALGLAKDQKENIEAVERLKSRMPELCPDSDQEDWGTKIEEFEATRRTLQEKKDQLLREVYQLGYNERPEPKDAIASAANWNGERANEVRNRINDLREEENQLFGEGTRLKAKISSACGVHSDSWEELIGALEQKISEFRELYREITATILGKHAVCVAVGKLQQKEDEMISTCLADPLLMDDLKEISGGRFAGYSWEGGHLNVVDSSGQAYSLDMLSTGAMEQVSLAMRLLFARSYLGDEPGFLLLDDAFQHSDWERRKQLVDYTISLVRVHKWQIFYFGMDDHLVDLFHKKANEIIPDDFSYNPL
jgi:DNA repair exonuclease SbcCD ATPase subunit